DLPWLDHHRQAATEGEQRHTSGVEQAVEIKRQQDTGATAHQRTNHATARPLHHENRHDVALAHALSLQNRHFSLLFHHHHNQRRNNIKRRDTNNQPEHQAHHVLFHFHRLKQLTALLTPVTPLPTLRQVLLSHLR